MSALRSTITLPISDFYLAVIGDISRSREIENRRLFQQQLHELMERLNRQWAAFVLSPFTVTLGDEFQAILRRADPLFDIFNQIETALAPWHIVIGVGVGRLETELFSHTSVGMDGPCLRLARQQVEQAKKQPPRLRFAIEALQTEQVNYHLLLQTILVNRQTSNQKKIIALYEQFGKQQPVAETLGISQAAVSQSLKAAHYQEVKESQQSIVAFINQFLPER